jgi:hypothetical protein
MIVSVHQPQFLPWLGYFDKIHQSDCFVILDTVQFKKNEFQNRNKLKTPQSPKWLTVPVSYRFPMRIDEVPINNQSNWRHKHTQSVLANYGKSPFFENSRNVLAEMYDREWERLTDLNTWCVTRLSEVIGIETPFRYARDFTLPDEPTGRLVQLCVDLGATTYLSGAGGRGYLDTEPFEKAGIEVVYQEYAHPVYAQQHGDFAPYMSVVDLLMNYGPESLAILTGQAE